MFDSVAVDGISGMTPDIGVKVHVGTVCDGLLFKYSSSLKRGFLADT